jgi:hypothetical protein
MKVNKGLIREIVNSGLIIEDKNREVLRSNLAKARNRLNQEVLRNPQNMSNTNKWQSLVNTYIDEYEVVVAKEFAIQGALKEGMKEGQLMVGDVASIPKDSSFYGWTPVLPLEAISLADSEFTNLIRKASVDLKENILRKTQQGLILGMSIGEIQREVLGTGLRGLKGRDGVFRSAVARAETIGRTVTNDLINRGALLTYGQINDISPELGLMKVWMTVSDRRTSNRCLSLSGQERPLEKDFQASDGWVGLSPPSHPNCRSRSAPLTNKKWKKDFDKRYSEETKKKKREKPFKKKEEKAKPKDKAPKINVKNLDPTKRYEGKKPSVDPTKVPLKFDKSKAITANPRINDEVLSQALLDSIDNRESYEALMRFYEKHELELIFNDIAKTPKKNFFITTDSKGFERVNYTKLPELIKEDPNFKALLNTKEAKKALAQGYSVDDVVDMVEGRYMPLSYNKLISSGKIVTGEGGYTSFYYRHVNTHTTSKAPFMKGKLKVNRAKLRDNFEKHYTENTTIGATYKPSYSTASQWAVKDLRDEETISILLHETGHQVRFRTGAVARPPNIKDTWTPYGQWDDEEWFAETFTTYMIRPDLLKKWDEASFNYMDTVVKSFM